MFQENSIETCTVSRMKQITSPGWMHETSARTWCTGKTQGEQVEREVGGGIGMGNTCKPMDVSFQCMTKSTTKKKKRKKEKKQLKEFQILNFFKSSVFHDALPCDTLKYTLKILITLESSDISYSWVKMVKSLSCQQQETT